MVDIPEEDRCKVIVFHPEKLRRTGRGKYGFERHYIEERCKRRAIYKGYCWQHAYKAEYE